MHITNWNLLKSLKNKQTGVHPVYNSSSRVLMSDAELYQSIRATTLTCRMLPEYYLGSRGGWFNGKKA